MTKITPIWRQALKDEQHPLHRAAWILFSENPNPQYTDHVLADQKKQVIEFIYQILDTDELYVESSLSRGNAPFNDVKLLGNLLVCDPEQAIPILEERLRQRKYSKDFKKRLEKYISDAKVGIFP